MARRPECLELFGVIHVDQHRKVTRELAPLVADADAICLEAPEPLDRETAVSATVHAPLCTLGAFLLELLAYLPLYLLFNRDTLSTEEVAVRAVAGDRPVYRVDRNPIELLATAGPAVVAANWVVLLGLVVVTPIQVALTVGTVGGCLLLPGLVRQRVHRLPGIGLAVAGVAVAYWLAFAGPLRLAPVGLVALLSLVVLVHGTVDRRNDVMLENTLERAAAGDHDRVVLVTGKAHLSGMVPQARDRGVDVGRVHVSRWLRAGRTYDGTVTDTGRVVDAAAISDRQASAGQRLRAGLVDAAAIALLWGCLAVVARATATVPLPVWQLVLGVPAVGTSYRGLLEATPGGTLGQRRQQLRVVDVSGEAIGLRTALARNVLLLADVALLFLPAMLDDRSRLVCEHLTGTHVVRQPDE